jgi:hypothetical protein
MYQQQGHNNNSSNSNITNGLAMDMRQSQPAQTHFVFETGGSHGSSRVISKVAVFVFFAWFSDLVAVPVIVT